MKPILIFFAMSCATTVYLNMDTTMLGFIKTDTDVGYYNAAVKIKNMLVGIVTSLGAVLLPRVTVYLEKKEQKRFEDLSVKAIQFVLFSSIPMLVYFTLFAEPSMLLLSGKEYERAILPMQIMLPTLLFIGLTNIMGIQILVPMGKESKVLASVIAGAVVDLVLNMILIPKYSVSGAAIGTVTAEVIVFIYQYFSDRELFQRLFSKINPWKIITATIASACMSVWILKLNADLPVVLIMSCICFGGIYIMSLIILRESFILELFRLMKR